MSEEKIELIAQLVAQGLEEKRLKPLSIAKLKLKLEPKDEAQDSAQDIAQCEEVPEEDSKEVLKEEVDEVEVNEQSCLFIPSDTDDKGELVVDAEQLVSEALEVDPKVELVQRLNDRVLHYLKLRRPNQARFLKALELALPGERPANHMIYKNMLNHIRPRPSAINNHSDIFALYEEFKRYK
jgi:hypothetical protein